MHLPQMGRDMSERIGGSSSSSASAFENNTSVVLPLLWMCDSSLKKSTVYTVTLFVEEKKGQGLTRGESYPEKSTSGLPRLCAVTAPPSAWHRGMQAQMGTALPGLKREKGGVHQSHSHAWGSAVALHALDTFALIESF